MIESYRESINPPYSKKDIPAIALTFALLLFLPALLLSAFQPRDVEERAAAINEVVFVDSGGNLITQTTSATVQVVLSAPWPVASTRDSGMPVAYRGEVQGIVNQAFAQGSVSQTLEAETMTLPSGASIFSDSAASNGQAVLMRTNGTLVGTVSTSGQINGVTVRARGDRCQGNPRMLVAIDGKSIMEVNVGNQSWADFTTSAFSFPSGEHTVRISFLNDRFRIFCDRNLRVDRVFFALTPQGGPTPTPTPPSPTATKTPTPIPTSTSTPTPTRTPTPIPTATPTKAPTPTSPPGVTATPTPTVITTASVTLAEDAGFTQNVQSHSYTNNPLTVSYTFATAIPGTKTLYAKFTASNGQIQVFSSSIELVGPSTPTPTPPSAPTVTPTPPSGGQNSHAMGLWTPSKWDTCTQAEHDSYKVLGPDGKWYPTWHPPVHTRAGGTTCTLGHEHGRDPNGSAMIPFINAQYGGILFGYANEKLDEYNAANGITNGMRHEDHVGHKIEWENNLQLGLSNTNKINAYCDFFLKAHQGTHSKDAFTNNLHELGYFVTCRDPGNTGYGNFSIGSYKFVAFGAPGEIGEACNKSMTYNTGAYAPPNSPTGDGIRFLPTRYCAETHFLVPNGTFTNVGLGLYEDWVSANYLRKAGAVDPLAYFDPHFAVFLPSRYYYPGHDSDNNAGNGIDNMGRSIDLCFEVEANGDQAHDGTCDLTTNYGSITGITWDDPRSRLNGVSREFYFNQTWIKNPSGPTTWYTDPYGANAQTTPFVGSVKQSIPQIDNYNKVILESQAIGSDRNYGGNGVHAPN